MLEVISRNIERTRAHRKSLEAAEEIKELNQRLMGELAQKERLASLGQASAEFVHDLSNPLTIVWGYVQILAKKLEQSNYGNGNGETISSSKELNIIEQNVRLCRDLLTMWQSYGSTRGSKPNPISISEILREVVKSSGGMAVENGVELNCNICDDQCTVLGEPIQLTRAIQNVIMNAIQASAEKKGSVAVSCMEKDFYADIRVEDTGYGIPAEQMSRIFDPYFTTKQGKSGTGLGLYITKKVIDDHQGSIKVESTPQIGTAFILRLPLVNNSL
jgi:two-component system NtrC family sensor kinase